MPQPVTSVVVYRDSSSSIGTRCPKSKGARSKPLVIAACCIRHMQYQPMTRTGMLMQHKPALVGVASQRSSARPIRRVRLTTCTASPPALYKTATNGGSSNVEQMTLPTLPPLPPTPPECAPPAGIVDKAIALGATKASYSIPKTLLGGVLAGALLSFGAATALTVGGACPAIASANPGLAKILMGSIGLPFGLTMVVVSGGELFTGNTCFVTAAALAGKARWSQVLANWVAAYAGNLVGSLVVVGLMCAAGVFAPGTAAPVNVAVAKTSMPFAQVGGT